jgi:hypothetical protein
MLDYSRFKEINELFAAGRTDEARHLLMEQQSQCIALQDEINMLRARVQTFEDILHIAQNLSREGDFYWLTTNDVRQGPFCLRCYESEGGLIRLERRRADLACPCCSATYPLPPLPGNGEERRAKIIPFREVVPRI